MLFSALWVYRTLVKTSTGFTRFQLVYSLEAVLPIECEIPSLQMAIELLPATSKEEKHYIFFLRKDRVNDTTELEKIEEEHQSAVDDLVGTYEQSVKLA